MVPDDGHIAAASANAPSSRSAAVPSAVVIPFTPVPPPGVDNAATVMPLAAAVAPIAVAPSSRAVDVPSAVLMPSTPVAVDNAAKVLSLAQVDPINALPSAAASSSWAEAAPDNETDDDNFLSPLPSTSNATSGEYLKEDTSNATSGEYLKEDTSTSRGDDRSSSESSSDSELPDDVFEDNFTSRGADRSSSESSPGSELVDDVFEDTSRSYTATQVPLSLTKYLTDLTSVVANYGLFS